MNENWEKKLLEGKKEFQNGSKRKEKRHKLNR